jgi:hypothetical protein
MTEEVRQFWIYWMSSLFQDSPLPPMSFVLSLFKTNPSHFQVMLKHVQQRTPGLDPAYMTDLKNAMRQTTLSRMIADFDAVFEFVEKCEDEIQQLAQAANSHIFLEKILSKSATRLPESAGQFSHLEELIAFCESNPPVLRVKPSDAMCSSITSFKFPGVFHSVISVSIDADGSQEAILRVMTTRGESARFLLVSPLLYQLAEKEHLFIATIERYIHTHPTSWSRQQFMYYPRSYLLHPKLLMVDSRPLCTFRDLAAPISVTAELAAKRSVLTEFQPDPLSIWELRQNQLSKSLLLEWFLRVSEGNRVNFFYIRQSFASHLAGLAVLHQTFGPAPLSAQSFAIAEDRQRVLLPGFFEFEKFQVEGNEFVTCLPITEQIGRLLPKYVLKGSFATTWHAVTDSIWRNLDEITLLLQIFLENQEDKRPGALEAAARAAGKMAQQIGEDTDKYDDPFQFALLDHLIECSPNALVCQLTRTGWI